jgi:hypothetical protein
MFRCWVLLFHNMEFLLGRSDLEKAIGLNQRQVAWSQTYLEGLRGKDKVDFDMVLDRSRRQLKSMDDDSIKILQETNEFIKAGRGMAPTEKYSPEQIKFILDRRSLISQHPQAMLIFNRLSYSQSVSRRKSSYLSG